MRLARQSDSVRCPTHNDEDAMAARTPFVPIRLADPPPLLAFPQDLEDLLRHRYGSFLEELDGSAFDDLGYTGIGRSGRQGG